MTKWSILSIKLALQTSTLGSINVADITMTHGRVSRVMTRLLRPFHHRSSKADKASSMRQRGFMASPSTSSSCSTPSSTSRSSSGCCKVAAARVFPLKTNVDGIPHTVMMPFAFFRHMRALVEQTLALTTGDQMRASCKGHDPSLSGSRASIRWRGDFSTKTLDKLVGILTESEVDGCTTSISRRSAKPVPLDIAAKAMLQLWNCCVQILELLAGGATPEPSLRHTIAHLKDVAVAAAIEKRRRLEQAALTLLVLVIRRQELNALLVVVGHGGCKYHKPTEETRHGMARLSLRLSRNSRHVSAAVNSGSRSSQSMIPKRSSRKMKKGQDRSVRLCDSVHRFLELHQSTLQYAFEKVYGPVDFSGTKPEFDSFDQHQELVAALVGTSYVRVPWLRSHMLEHLSNRLSLSALSSERDRSLFEEKLRLTPFNWHRGAYPQCQSLLSTVNSDDCWSASAQRLDQHMIDSDGIMLVLAQIFEHLTGQQVVGQTNWTYVPGVEVLQDATLEMTKSQYHMELQQCEPKWQEDMEEEVGNKADLASQKEAMPYRDSFSLMDGSTEDVNKLTAYFSVQVTSMMSENAGFIHEYLMTILRSTNYMLPHHVTLCLQYMEKLLSDFPDFFSSEPSAQNSLTHATMDTSNQPQQKHTCADVETLHHVFSCLLDSEHFEILKATELFLLRNFMNLSAALQLQLTNLLALHLKRLFVHWNHDVRYCYYHILLYLTYPANRLVLGAKSDEILMGSKASRLFDIPGLVRSSNTTNWGVFDTPLVQIITRYMQMTKHRPRVKATSTWVDTIPESLVQRVVGEYKTYVTMYFKYAQRVSMHQRVPTPIFSIKTVDNASSCEDTNRSNATVRLA